MEPKIGQPVRRKEDLRLLTGRGQFSDDFNMPGQAYAAMVRSVHAHARLKNIDTARARAMPGVLAVLTGADCLADGLAEIPHSPVPSGRTDLKLKGPDGGGVFAGPQIFLPADKARHVGEALVMVVAETLPKAMDAAEEVAIEYEALPAVTDTDAASMSGAPVVWDEVPDNVCVDTSFGDAKGTDAAFAAANRVIEMVFNVGRVTGVPMEPRAAVGGFDPATGRYTLFAGSGSAVRQKKELAGALGEPAENLRVVACDVGGNFGTRNRVYVEFGLVLWAAKKLGRPVKYIAQRSESFISDYQGRDLITHVELALDNAGKFLALRASNLSNVGARIVSLSPLAKGSALVTGPYAIPVATVRSRAVFSNTPPTQAYRSSGRPEVTFALERLIDTAAHEFGLDPIELRRRNFIPPGAMPYTNALGMVYDSGEFEANMNTAMKMADWNGFEGRRDEARKRGKILGLGLANYLESSSGTPGERAEMTVKPEGEVDIVIGTQPSGQGHETSFSQVAAEWLGVPVDSVRVILGDTDVVRVGGGSHSGRSMRMAGTVIVMASDEIIAKGKKIAAHVLEASEADIVFAKGRFTITGTDRSLGFFKIAAEAAREDLPDALAGGLAVVADNDMHTPVFPNGCHACEVEIDAETGGVALVRYCAIDDVGRAINPLIVDGQTHGGIAQGVGQALGEQAVCHPDSGQPLCGSFMDYQMPRAQDLPSFATALNEVFCPTNPLGIKAGGEGGTTPAPGVVINAIVNALREFGVRDIKMPATSLRVWQAIQGRKS